MIKMKALLTLLALSLLVSCGGSSKNIDPNSGDGGSDPVDPPQDTWELPNIFGATVALGNESNGEVAMYRYELFVAVDKIDFSHDCYSFSSKIPDLRLQFERIAIETPNGFMYDVGHKIKGGVEVTLIDMFQNEGWVEYVVCFRNRSTVTIRPDSYTIFIFSNDLVEMELNPGACEGFRSEYLVETLGE